MGKKAQTRWTPKGMLAHRRRRRSMKVGLIAAALAGAAMLGGTVALVAELLPNGFSSPAATPIRYAEVLSGCSVTDGDTIRCETERIRLLGIDAPEMPGHCRPGRDCVEGDPYASASNLAAAMTGQLTIGRAGEDRYGRTLAVIAGSHGDLSCWQLKHKQVIYKADWDDGFRVARACPSEVF
jgi:micrococcal nuclease